MESDAWRLGFFVCELRPVHRFALRREYWSEVLFFPIEDLLLYDTAEDAIRRADANQNILADLPGGAEAVSARRVELLIEHMQDAALRRIEKRTGTLVHEQVRNAVQVYIDKQDGKEIRRVPYWLVCGRCGPGRMRHELTAVASNGSCLDFYRSTRNSDHRLAVRTLSHNRWVQGTEQWLLDDEAEDALKVCGLGD